VIFEPQIEKLRTLAAGQLAEAERRRNDADEARKDAERSQRNAVHFDAEAALCEQRGDTYTLIADALASGNLTPELLASYGTAVSS
jgi:hypothetical protein